MSASYTLRGFLGMPGEQSMMSWTVLHYPCSAVLCLEVSFWALSSNGTISSTRRTGARERKDLSHWAGMSALHCWPQSVVSAVKSAISGIQPVDMRYRIRKRTGEPHDTRGLLSGDYWIFVGCCSAAFVLFFLRHPCGDIRRQLEPAGPGARHLAAHPAAASIQAEKKGTTPKFKETGKEINISNPGHKRGNKKEHNENQKRHTAYLTSSSESEGQGVVLTAAATYAFLSNSGNECYSAPEDIDRRDGMFRKPSSFSGRGTYVHKQDVFLKGRLLSGHCRRFFP